MDGEEKQERDMEGVGGGHRQVSQGMQEEIESRGLVEVEKVRVKENNNEEELHLFYHHLPPLSLSDKLVLLVAGIFLVPIRLFLAVLVMLSAWLVSGLGLMFRDKEAFERQPQGGWRGLCREYMYKATSSVILSCLGFRLVIEGEAASRDDAPVVICAPHTSFLDVFVIAICKGSPVARIENSKTPGMSAIQTVGHTIFVDRCSDQSRRAALQNIVARVVSPLSWPKVFIFAEGTTTNGQALIRFQSGGFQAGRPVQPVTVRYSHPHLTTWTRDQAHGLRWSMLLLLATPFKTVTVKFMPVHTPTPEEETDPILFAKAVQREMALELGVPATDVQRAEFVKELRKEK